jgi:hypothetical protein
MLQTIRRILRIGGTSLDPSAIRARVVGGHVDPSTLRRLWFKAQVLESERITDRDVDDFGAISSTFYRCDFSRLRAENATFGAGTEPSTYVECSFDGARIVHSIVGRARFERCTFHDVHLGQFWAQNAEFIGCGFSGKIRTAIFAGRPIREDVKRTHNEFSGNDFSGAYLHDVAFRAGIDLNSQTLPRGPGYLFCPDGRAAVGRASHRLTELSGATGEVAARALLQTLRADVDGGQEQLFLCLNSLCRNPSTAEEAVLQALEAPDS